MTIAKTIVSVCLSIFLLYWIINWSQVKPSLEKRNYGGVKFRLIIAAVVIILLLFNHFVLHNVIHFPLCEWGWSGCHYHLSFASSNPSLPLQALSIVFAISGIIVAVVARRTLADNWSSVPEVKIDHKLITSGIYHYVRHPIYTGVLLLLLAAVLAFPSLPALVMVIVVPFVYFDRIKKEEELMTKTFPKEYPRYKKQTKTLIPYFW